MISEEGIVGKTPATAMIVINSSRVNAFWVLAEANKDKYLQNLRFKGVFILYKRVKVFTSFLDYSVIHLADIDDLGR
jgi:hypothetical protein